MQITAKILDLEQDKYGVSPTPSLLELISLPCLSLLVSLHTTNWPQWDVTSRSMDRYRQSDRERERGRNRYRERKRDRDRDRTFWFSSSSLMQSCCYQNDIWHMADIIRLRQQGHSYSCWALLNVLLSPLFFSLSLSLFLIFFLCLSAHLHI